MKKSIEELIYDETNQRLKEMSVPGYQFPERADIKDAVGIIVAISISLLLIALCMMEVII